MTIDRVLDWMIGFIAPYAFNISVYVEVRSFLNQLPNKINFISFVAGFINVLVLYNCLNM
jgi:hypothetical protein